MLISRRTTLAAMTAFTLALPVLSACDGIAVDYWDEREFDVNVPAGAPTTFSDSKTVNLADNKDLKDQLKHVKKVEVTEIWLETSKLDATNAATKAGGKVEVSTTADGAPHTLVGDYQDLPITEGGKLKLTPTAEQLKTVEDLAFNAPNAFKTYYTASFDGVPAKFHVKVRIHFVATVGL